MSEWISVDEWLPDSQRPWSFECPAVEDMTFIDRVSIVRFIMQVLEVGELVSPGAPHE